MTLGVAAAAAAALFALPEREAEISGDPTAVVEPDTKSSTDAREGPETPTREAVPSVAPAERPPEAPTPAAPTRSEPPPQPSRRSASGRAHAHTVGAPMAPDDVLAHTALTVPPRTYRGFTPAKPTLAALLMVCDLHPERLNSPCAADMDLIESIAEGAGSTSGLWAPNSENLLRDFFEEHGPLTVEQVICSDDGCIVDGLAPSKSTVPWEVSEAADLDTIAELRAEPWYQQYFEADGRPEWAPDPETGGFERIVVLRRRTKP